MIPPMDWPHPEVGKAWDGESVPHGCAIAGMIVRDGEVVDPGRIYTPEEWAVVGADVRKFLALRNAEDWRAARRAATK